MCVLLELHVCVENKEGLARVCALAVTTLQPYFQQVPTEITTSNCLAPIAEPQSPFMQKLLGGSIHIPKPQRSY
jgi:hypothetical protein